MIGVRNIVEHSEFRDLAQRFRVMGVGLCSLALGRQA